MYSDVFYYVIKYQNDSLAGTGSPYIIKLFSKFPWKLHNFNISDFIGRVSIILWTIMRIRYMFVNQLLINLAFSGNGLALIFSNWYLLWFGIFSLLRCLLVFIQSITKAISKSKGQSISFQRYSIKQVSSAVE